MKNSLEEYVDFGAPADCLKRHFYVEIPASPREAVCIYEDFGCDLGENPDGRPACRAVVARELWTVLKDAVRGDFNARLKTKKMSTGSWKIGRVRLDRFLGRELCVLAWAAEHASKDECPIVCQKWLALRPEERWWLYSKTAAEAGGEGDKDKGWRKALYCALSDGEAVRLVVKVQPKIKKRTKAEEPLLQMLHESKLNGDEGLARNLFHSPLPENEERGTI